MAKNEYADAYAQVNKALAEHVYGKAEDFPLVGRDKALAGKADALKSPKAPMAPKAMAPKTAPMTPSAPAGMNPMVPSLKPKKPASTITMDYIKEQKQKLALKSEDTDVEGLLWLYTTSEGLLELAKAEDDSKVARWESGSGKHWVDLTSHSDGSYSYSAPGASGHLGKLPSHDHAIKHMQQKVDSGYFLPDAAKKPMKRVK